MSRRFVGNPAYLDYETLMIKLHRLIGSGQGESDEADQIRDQMDGPWRALSGDERARISGLSADLYMLQDDEVFEKAEPSERSAETLGLALMEARKRNDWQAVLSLLRKGPTFFSKANIAFLRGLSYLQLGDPEPALLFLDHAAKLDPEESNYKLFAMDALVRLGRFEEELDRARGYVSDRNGAVALFVHSASVVFRATRSLSEAAARPIYEQLHSALNSRLDQGTDGVRDDRESTAFGFLLLALCMESLGRNDEAVSACDMSARLDPNGSALIIARKMLLEQMGAPAGAVANGNNNSDSQDNYASHHRENRFKIVAMAKPPPKAA